MQLLLRTDQKRSSNAVLNGRPYRGDVNFTYDELPDRLF